MEELIGILDKTVSSSTQADQAEVVAYIQNCVQRDFPGFLVALSDVLHNQNNTALVRAAAGLQLKAHLTGRDEHKDRWRKLPESTKQHVRNRVFQALGTESFRPSSAAATLAHIALLDLPDNQWPGLIEALAANVTNPNSSQQLKLVSLEAIGYICSSKDNIEQGLIQPMDVMMDAIGNYGMRDEESDDVKRAATGALLNLCEPRIREISKLHQSISFQELGQQLNIEHEHAERIIAQMVREERIQGHLNQIEGIVHFDSKDVLQVFDDEILKLCGDVNIIVEKIKQVVPDEWWSQNFNK